MGVQDSARDLAPSGVKRTEKAANALSQNPLGNTDAWYSSTAVRARRTADIASDYFPFSPKIKHDDRLYTFSFFDLLKFVKNLDDSLDSAILFGHNEAFTEFVNRMGDHFIDRLPTSGVAIIEFDTDKWENIGRGNTKTIIKPKEL